MGLSENPPKLGRTASEDGADDAMKRQWMLIDERASQQECFSTDRFHMLEDLLQFTPR